MLLNIEHEEPRRKRLRFLVPVAIGMAAILIAETAFILYSVQASGAKLPGPTSDVGLTHSIGVNLFTAYLLPFEVTSVLLLMAMVGAISLARQSNLLSSTARVVPGAQVLAMDIVKPRGKEDLTAVQTETTDGAAQLMGVEFQSDPEKRE